MLPGSGSMYSVASKMTAKQLTAYDGAIMIYIAHICGIAGVESKGRSDKLKKQHKLQDTPHTRQPVALVLETHLLQRDLQRQGQVAGCWVARFSQEQQTVAVSRLQVSLNAAA